MVKINGSNNEKSACISVDPFKRHVTVFNPLSSYNRPVQFPKAFAYDAIFDDDDSSVSLLVVHFEMSNKFQAMNKWPL